MQPTQRKPQPAGVTSEESLHVHFVLHRTHAAHRLDHLHRVLDVCSRVDEATELHSALECLDVDFTGLQGGIVEDRGLHLGGDGGGGASHHTGERGSREQEHGEAMWDVFHEGLSESRAEWAVQAEAALHGNRHTQPVPWPPR